MSFDTFNILCYSASLVMIVVCVFSAIMRIFHVCKPYQGNARLYYPARGVFEFCLLMHLLFVPYLFSVGTELGIRYSTTMLLMLHPFVYSILIDAAFFLKKVRLWWALGITVSIAGLIVMPLMYYVEANNLISDEFLMFMRRLPSMIFVAGIFYMVAPLRKLTLKIANHNRMSYSSSKDFPFSFAYLMLVPPYLFTVYLLVMYYLQSELMLMIFNVMFTIIVGAISIYSLHPIRDFSTMAKREEENDMTDTLESEVEATSDDDSSVRRTLVDEHEIEQMIAYTDNDKLLVKQTEEILVSRQLFKLSYLKISDVYPLLNTSKDALTNAISKSQYGSFYNLVNTYRLQYAMELMDKMSDFKLRNISSEAGFASPSQFSQFFKEQTGDTPSRWIKSRR